VTNSLRVELAEQKTQVVGVHLGFADTDMIAGLPVDKLSPAEVVEAVLTGLEEGRTEVLVDSASEHFKAALAGPVEGLTLPLPF
jgi:NAD(P)-dependent dehydrogenase (short-subunit alcohol dehydrogenase family)